MVDGQGTEVVQISEREILITRVVAAPPRAVWAAWVDPRQLERWWGPRGFSLSIQAMDAAPGGELRGVMTAGDGSQFLLRCSFTEVEPQRRITYVMIGGPKDDDQVECTVTWTFEETAGKTRISLRMSYADDDAWRRSMEVHGAVEGGTQTLGRLESFLCSSRSADRADFAPDGVLS
jgi:uncharacterized protein YndB with AHSA1/START domain